MVAGSGRVMRMLLRGWVDACGSIDDSASGCQSGSLQYGMAMLARRAGV